jgi:ribosomal protein S18 acetylase RimI-like enzyme
MPDFLIRPLVPTDCDWVKRLTVADWGAEIVVAHNEVFRPADLPGFVAFSGEESIGLLTYNIKGDECEIVTLNSWKEGRGIGSALIEATRQVAGRVDCRRVFLVTTNNNTHALHFYQKRGFTISAVRINVIADSRKLKPQIPLMDRDGLPIRDEIELEMILERNRPYH